MTMTIYMDTQTGECYTVDEYDDIKEELFNELYDEHENRREFCELYRLDMTSDFVVPYHQRQYCRYIDKLVERDLAHIKKAKAEFS